MPLNVRGAEIAIELLAWDKARSAGYLGSPPPAQLEALIEDGAEAYQQVVAALHGEGAFDEERSEKWLEASRSERRDREYMTKPPHLFKPGREVLLTEEDHARLDRKHPEQSFSGQRFERDADQPDTMQLERLETLHRDGVLTDEEYEAARGRILSRD